MPKDERSLADLIKELRDEMTTLFRQEVALVRAEMTEKAQIVARNGALMAAAGAVAYAAVLLILYGLSVALRVAMIALGAAPTLAAWLAPLLLGIVVALIAFVLFRQGATALKNARLAPEEARRSLQKDKEMLQGRIGR